MLDSKYIETEILPVIKSLIDNEKLHIESLKKRKAPIEMINRSEDYLSYYQQRYLEYKEYRKKNEI